ncbi:unnamed protein product [Prunus armeniaca]|uniref:X8 domain-containing protein n=1 Tax=Prunus armeniaca TaxID=36596 RepID=A0A6J5UIX7_PRUAR|nr:unnamed protein product [Prunus armeniaca]
MAKLALPGEISMLVNGQKAWCVAKPAAPQQALQSTLDYACNYADCSPTKKGGSWYDPDRPVHRASFAMKMGIYYYGICDHTYDKFATILREFDIVVQRS